MGGKGVSLSRKLKLLEIKSELGAGTRGSSLGIDALKIAALNSKNDFFQRYDSAALEIDNYALFNTIQNPHAKHIQDILDIYERICNRVAHELKTHETPIVLAGDHSSAGGTIAGIKQAFPDKRLGVIWLDAHSDIHSPYTTHSGNMHGMPLATALAEDNQINARNFVLPETINLWNKLKEIGGMSPKIDASDLVFIGTRDLEIEEERLIKQLGIRFCGVEEVRGKGIEESTYETLAYLSQCDLLYVSFDVDSLDSELVSSGTGTPVPDGFSPAEVDQILRIVAADPRLCAFEVVEINPTLDVQNKMARVAFDILANVCAVIECTSPNF